MPSELTTALLHFKSPHRMISDLDLTRYTLREILVSIAEVCAAGAAFKVSRASTLLRVMQSIAGPGLPCAHEPGTPSIFDYAEADGVVRIFLRDAFWGQNIGPRFLQFQFTEEADTVHVSAICDSGKLMLDVPAQESLGSYLAKVRSDAFLCAKDHIGVVDSVKKILDAHGVRVWSVISDPKYTL